MKKISLVLSIFMLILNNLRAQEHKPTVKEMTARHLTALDSIKKNLDRELLQKIDLLSHEKEQAHLLNDYLDAYEDRLDYALYEEMIKLREELGMEKETDEEDHFSWKKVVIKVLEKSEKDEKKHAPSETEKEVRKKEDKKGSKNRISSELYIGLGMNNFYENTPSDYIQPEDYNFQKSGFVELSWIFKFYMDKHNRSYINTGVGVMWNKLSPANNQYHVVDNGKVKLDGFPEDLTLSKMRTAWLKVPLGIGFELPVSSDIEVSFGVSAYGKMKIGSIQKLEYAMNGAEYEVKEKRDFRQEKFNYGIQGFIGIEGIQIYGGMDFAPYFMNQSGKMYFIGIRL